MSLENRLRSAMLRTVLNHLLKNQEKSPERTARNIGEVLLKYSQLPQPADYAPIGYDELLDIIRSHSREDSIELILNRFSRPDPGH